MARIMHVSPHELISTPSTTCDTRFGAPCGQPKRRMEFSARTAHDLTQHVLGSRLQPFPQLLQRVSKRLFTELGLRTALVSGFRIDLSLGSLQAWIGVSHGQCRDYNAMPPLADSSTSGVVSLVFIVPAYPEPGDRITLEHANRTVSQRYPHRPDVFLRVYALEVQRRMEGVLRP